MPAKEEDYRITVGDLRQQLAQYPDDAQLIFGSTVAGIPLIFYRVKNRSPRVAQPHEMLIQIELNELNQLD